MPSEENVQNVIIFRPVSPVFTSGKFFVDFHWYRNVLSKISYFIKKGRGVCFSATDPDRFTDKNI